MRTVFLRKTAIATAMEVDHLAQTAIAFAEMRLSLWQSGVGKCWNDIVPCANRHRIYRNKIVPPTKCHRQMPKRYCPLSKSSSHLPKWNCPSDKVASANAEARLSLAQMLIAIAETKLSLRHWGFGNRDRTLHTMAGRSPHLRWKYCRRNKCHPPLCNKIYTPKQKQNNLGRMIFSSQVISIIMLRIYRLHLDKHYLTGGSPNQRVRISTISRRISSGILPMRAVCEPRGWTNTRMFFLLRNQVTPAAVQGSISP